jgi:L-asparaginase
VIRPRPTPALFLHGGAGWSANPARRRRIRARLLAIREAAYRHLANCSALDVVVEVVRRLEDDPLFNAGTGSVLQADRRACMSASVMDGATRRFAAVLNVERVRNPVVAAQALLSAEDRVLDGTGATRFARSIGLGPWDPATPERLRQWKQRLGESHGTVGAVAMDADGRFAAATSTGGKGTAFTVRGRVSDSGLPAGNYATDLAAVSCTGIGEDIVDEALAVRLTQQVADGRTLARAFASTFRQMRARQRKLAAIGVDRSGLLAWGSTLPNLYAAGRSGRRTIETFER